MFLDALSSEVAAVAAYRRQRNSMGARRRCSPTAHGARLRASSRTRSIITGFPRSFALHRNNRARQYHDLLRIGVFLHLHAAAANQRNAQFVIVVRTHARASDGETMPEKSVLVFDAHALAPPPRHDHVMVNRSRAIASARAALRAGNHSTPTSIAGLAVPTRDWASGAVNETITAQLRERQFSDRKRRSRMRSCCAYTRRTGWRRC